MLSDSTCPGDCVGYEAVTLRSRPLLKLLLCDRNHMSTLPFVSHSLGGNQWKLEGQEAWRSSSWLSPAFGCTPGTWPSLPAQWDLKQLVGSPDERAEVQQPGPLLSEPEVSPPARHHPPSQDDQPSRFIMHPSGLNRKTRTVGHSLCHSSVMLLLLDSSSFLFLFSSTRKFQKLPECFPLVFSVNFHVFNQSPILNSHLE
jgi:hypothetical protein